LPFDDPDAFFAEVKSCADSFLPAMHAVASGTHIDFDVLSATPGFDTHEGSEITALGGACNGTHEFGKVSFGTEASLFHNANVPTVICGPGHIAQAHQPNEWVALDQVSRCESFMRRLADQVCAD